MAASIMAIPAPRPWSEAQSCRDSVSWSNLWSYSGGTSGGSLRRSSHELHAAHNSIGSRSKRPIVVASGRNLGSVGGADAKSSVGSPMQQA